MEPRWLARRGQGGDTQKNIQANHFMSKVKKLALGILMVLVVLVAGVAIIVPMLANIDRYRPQVAAQIAKETGKPVEIGRLTLTILPRVAIRVDDFALGNPDGFPKGDFIKAKKIYAAVNAFELMHHKVDITSLQFDDLTLDMLEDAHGKWNFENPPAAVAASSTPPSQGGPSFTLGVISKVSIARGNFSAASLLESGARGPSLLEVKSATVDLHDVNLNAMSASASLHLHSPAPGEFAQLESWFNTTVRAADNPGPSVAEGTIKADAVAFGPLNITKLKSKIRLYPQQVFFDDLNLNCYDGSAAGNLSLNFGGPNLAYTVDAELKGVKIAQFLDAFPQTKGMLTGTLEGAVKMQGLVLKSSDPLQGVTGSGNGIIRDGKMPSLQITGNLRSIAKLASVGPADGDASSFHSLSADFQIADSRLSSNKIDLDGNGVDVVGSGSLTMAGEGTLDYQGDASIAAGGSNPLVAVLGGLAGATYTDGKLTFPFTVAGTFAKPKFSMKGGGLADKGAAPDNVQKNVKLVRGLSELLKKRSE
jgi:uncharacterized protein involved in outer membrane biogenesis